MGFNHFIQIYHFPWSNDLSFYPFSCCHYMLFPLCGLDEIQCFSFSVLIPGLEVSQLDILVLLHVDGHQLQLGPTLLRLSFPFSAVTAICRPSYKNHSITFGPSSRSCSVSYPVWWFYLLVKSLRSPCSVDLQCCRGTIILPEFMLWLQH